MAADLIGDGLQSTQVFRTELHRERPEVLPEELRMASSGDRHYILTTREHPGQRDLAGPGTDLSRDLGHGVGASALLWSNTSAPKRG